MTTAYTPILKLALPVTGELSGTWGNVVNDNITSMVEQAVAGLATINTWTSNVHTLTTADGTTSESRCAMLVAATGAGGTALSAAGQIVCPAASKLYVLQNGSAYAVTLKTASGTGVAVPAGQAAFLFCDGTNVNACVTTIVDASVSGNLTVDGNTTLGNATTDTITATGQFNTDLLPSTDNARDLGSVANSWRTLYCQTSVLGGNLSLASNTVSSTNTDGDINIVPNGTGKVVLPNLRLSGSSSGYVGLQAAASAGSTTYTLPSTDGTTGQVLSTNGSGTLAWATAAASGVTTFSAGTTGFTPSTATSGAVTLAGTLAIANGGTGQTTATAATNALLPSQAANSGKYLTTDGTNTSWGTVSASPGGSTTQIQYNNAGAFGASSNLTWDNTTSTLTVNSINIGRGGNNIATNMFIGTAATGATASSLKNVAVGIAALNGVTNGQLNVAVGWNALNGINTGTQNVAIGNNAGAVLTNASFNTAVGAFALDNATGGSSNVALGYSALTGDVTGSNNTSVGASSGQALTSGTNNVFVGYLAGSAVDVGFSTVAVGGNALRSVVSSGYNVGVGEYAGRDTTGQQNTLIGWQAGYTLAAGDNNTIIGYNAVPSSTTASNEITLGNSSIATLRCQVTTITALSDARDKKDVQDIPLGVSFVQRLRPVSFVWNTRDGGKVDVPEFGFIAQELRQAQTDHGVTLPGLVHDINPERLEAAPGTLIPVLVKAVQELQAQIDDLKRQLAARG